MRRIHVTGDYGVEGWRWIPRWHAAARIVGQHTLVFFAVIGVCWTVASLVWP